MTLQEFVAYWTGKPLIFPGVKDIQCMSVMHQYLYDVLNLTDKTYLAQPIARLVYENFDTDNGRQYFEKISNVPGDMNNYPLPGDIIFWGYPAGPDNTSGTMVYDGHVAVCITADGNKITSFDENWPENANPHIQEHDYIGVLGWLRPNPQEIASLPNTSQLQAQVKQESDIATQCQAQLATANKTIVTQQKNIDTLVQDKAGLQKTIDDLQLKYTNEQNKTLTLSQANQLLSQGHLDQTGEILDAQHEVTALTNNLTHIAAAFDITYTNVKPDDLTTTIITHANTAVAANRQLQDQLKRYNDIKQAIDPVTKQGFWKSLKSIFVTQR